jgi:hypothetical protein
LVGVMTEVRKLKEFARRAYGAATDDRKVWIELCTLGLALRAAGGGKRFSRLVAWSKIESGASIEALADIEVDALLDGLRRAIEEPSPDKRDGLR